MLAGLCSTGIPRVDAHAHLSASQPIRPVDTQNDGPGATNLDESGPFVRERAGTQPQVQPHVGVASEETRKLFDDFMQQGILVMEEDTDGRGPLADDNPNQLLLDGRAKFRKQAVAPDAMMLSADRIRNMKELPNCAPSQRVAICAIMKNAAPSLPQWLVWHRLLGVGSFHIFDDHSTDNTPEVVRPWVEAGVLTHEQAPASGKRESIQLVAYKSCMERYGPQHEWIGFIDADELVQPMNDESVCLPNFLSREEFARAGVVSLNWMVTGSGDDYILTNEPPAREGAKDPTTLWDLNGFGNGDFGDQNQPTLNQHVKSFCRPARSQSSFQTPHFCLPKDGALQLSETAQSCQGSFNGPPTNAHLQIAHHYSMSLQ